MYDNVKPLVSVILPVWNPGMGILRCIKSLRNQTLTNIEMIFVDDCGNDDSMDMVCAAAEEDPRIRIIKNDTNIGAGPSRNRGIEVSQGEYLSFVDPDDYVADNFLELLYTKAREQDFDIVKGVRIREKENGTIVNTTTNLNGIIRQALSASKPLYTVFTYEHQTAIYRKALIVSNDIRYGTSSRGEDRTFLLQVCAKAKSISLTGDASYHFCERAESAMHKLDELHLSGIVQSLHEKTDYVLRELSKDASAPDYLKDQFISAINEATRYDDISENNEIIKNYAEALQCEWLRLPFREELAKHSFPLRCLQDSALLMPIAPFHLPWESSNPPISYAKLAQRWMDYYLNKPKEESLCEEHLLQILTRANLAVVGKPSSTYSTEERKQGQRLLQEQLLRLPTSLRRRLAARTAISRVVTSLPKPAKRIITIVLNRQ